MNICNCGLFWQGKSIAVVMWNTNVASCCRRQRFRQLSLRETPRHMGALTVHQNMFYNLLLTELVNKTALFPAAILGQSSWKRSKHPKRINLPPLPPAPLPHSAWLSDMSLYVGIPRQTFPKQEEEGIPAILSLWANVPKLGQLPLM